MSSARRAADGNRKEYKTRTETRRLVGSRTGQNLKVTDLPLSSPLSDRVGLWAFSIRRIPLVRGALHPTPSGEFRNCPSRPPHSTATPHKDDSRPSCRPTSRPRANQRILTLSATAPPKTGNHHSKELPTRGVGLTMTRAEGLPCCLGNSSRLLQGPAGAKGAAKDQT